MATTGVLLAASLLCGAAAVKARSLQAASPEAPVAPAPVVSDGPTLFRQRGCAHCHEIEGIGGGKGPDLSGVGRRLKKDAIERQIVQGGDAMPAFGEVLPSEEVAALVGYLHRCKDKHKPAARPSATPAPAPEESGY